MAAGMALVQKVEPTTTAAGVVALVAAGKAAMAAAAEAEGVAVEG